MGDETANNTNPRSMRQKRILDAAESHSEASIEELASLVPSATPTQIESILEEYGDPAAESPDSDLHTENETTGATEEQFENAGKPQDAPEIDTEASRSKKQPKTPSDTLDSITDLPPAQREVLREVAADPTATQDTIGERLGVSGSTVSNRVKDIPGFDWRNRESFITDTMTDSPSTAVVSDGGVAQDAAPMESVDSANEDMAVAISEIQSSSTKSKQLSIPSQTHPAIILNRTTRVSYRIPSSSIAWFTHVSNRTPSQKQKNSKYYAPSSPNHRHFSRLPILNHAQFTL